MKEFSSLNIKPQTTALKGDKISIDKVINKEIIVHRFQIRDSKFKDNEKIKNNDKCLYIEIFHKDDYHVVFTGSGVLMDQIQQVKDSDFPFKTTITKEDKRYQFT
jgi:hypothetical protein